MLLTFNERKIRLDAFVWEENFSLSQEQRNKKIIFHFNENIETNVRCNQIQKRKIPKNSWVKIFFNTNEGNRRYMCPQEQFFLFRFDFSQIIIPCSVLSQINEYIQRNNSHCDYLHESTSKSIVPLKLIKVLQITNLFQRFFPRQFQRRLLAKTSYKNLSRSFVINPMAPM